MSEAEPDWYDGFFDDVYLDELGLHIPHERTRHEADFVVERLELEPGERILDVGCGHGRHSLELARRGLRVAGVDLSPRSLEHARAAAVAEGLEADFERRDMRELDFDGEFDAVVNLFAAFGYFDDDADDERVVRGVARALRPGGRFLIETLNLLGLVPRYRDRTWEETHAGATLLAEHRFDVLRGRNEATWTFVRVDGSRRESRSRVRLFTPHELAALLERAGLRVTGSWGSYDGEELTMLSHRLILRAERP